MCDGCKILNTQRGFKIPDAKIIFFQGHQEWIGMPGTNYVKSIGGEIIKSDYYSRLTRTRS